MFSSSHYTSQLRVEGRVLPLGDFFSAEDAAQAYDR